ncbi:MAG: ABC transporter substrate-binding protein [Candidatus Hermodarchaeota archaeon]
MQPVLTQEQQYFFSTTLLGPTCNPVRVQHAQLIVNELPKIGIRGDLILVGWDVLLPRMMGSPTHADYAHEGFDIGFLSWAGSMIPNNLFQFFHSSNIDPANWGPNYYPVNNKTLDRILEFTINTTDFNQRKEYIRQALEIIVWDIQPVAGIYQPEDVFYLRDNIQGFDANRFPKIEEMSFANGHSAGHGQVNELIVASASRPQNFNLALSNSWYDKLVFSSAFTKLIEQAKNLTFVPGLVELLPYPVAVKNNHTGELSSTDPNTATVWELKLREDVYWHEGYGYQLNNATHRDILKVDADDVVWFYTVNVKPNGIPSSFRSSLQYAFGTEADKAFVKVDRYTVQFHLKNLYADLFTLFGAILPQHILDLTYDALGLGLGVRADGTSAPSYEDWAEDDFNIGYRTSGDITHAATIGNGPYYLYPGKNEGQQKIILTKWNHYFKDNDSYWQFLVIKRPDKYIYTWFLSKDAAEIALENGTIDLMDAQYNAEKDYAFMKDRPGVAAVKQLDWGYRTMGYNILNGANGKLANKWVRLAISHMITRQEMVKYLLGGLGKPSFVPFPQQSLYWPEDLEPITYNITRALDYMERAGYDVVPFRNSESSINTLFDFITFNLVSLVTIGLEVGAICLLVVLIVKKRLNPSKKI